jgi:hypothetical protein
MHASPALPKDVLYHAVLGHWRRSHAEVALLVAELRGAETAAQLSRICWSALRLAHERARAHAFRRWAAAADRLEFERERRQLLSRERLARGAAKELEAALAGAQEQRRMLADRGDRVLVADVHGRATDPREWLGSSVEDSSSVSWHAQHSRHAPAQLDDDHSADGVLSCRAKWLVGAWQRSASAHT